jgi:DTW domain-containing protein YfiP
MQRRIVVRRLARRATVKMLHKGSRIGRCLPIAQNRQLTLFSHTEGILPMSASDLIFKDSEVYHESTGRTVARMMGGRDDAEVKAYGHLFEAAPKMLAALQAVRVLPLYGDGTGSIRKLVTAAINAAEGK